MRSGDKMSFVRFLLYALILAAILTIGWPIELSGFYAILSLQRAGEFWAVSSWVLFIVIYVGAWIAEFRLGKNVGRNRSISTKNYQGTLYVWGSLTFVAYGLVNTTSNRSFELVSSNYVIVGVPVGVVIGIILSLFGLVLVLLGRVALNGQWGMHIYTYMGQHRTLVTDGLYRFCRHPIYGGQFWLCLATAFVLNCWLVIFFPILTYVENRRRAGAEDRCLEQEFGEVYKIYLNTGPGYMLFPHTGDLRFTPKVVIRPKVEEPVSRG